MLDDLKTLEAYIPQFLLEPTNAVVRCYFHTHIKPLEKLSTFTATHKQAREAKLAKTPTGKAVRAFALRDLIRQRARQGKRESAKYRYNTLHWDTVHIYR